MILNTFLRWAETARASERAKAAAALVHAYLTLSPQDDRRSSAIQVMLHLLDDPSPSVRQVMAEKLASTPLAPRAVILGLAEDQPEVACHVITLSPVMTESDLVDLVGRGSQITRALIAARPFLSSGVSAAIAEVGDVPEICLLLRNETASVTRYSLRRIAERQAGEGEIRSLLLDREDLPADARDILIQQVSKALAGSPLVQTTLSAARIAYTTRCATDSATLLLAGSALGDEIPKLVEHLRENGRLTPSFLIHALSVGRIEFFAGAVTSLSGLEDRRVRSILATGRRHAIRALFETIGIGRDIAEVFVEAILLWRDMARSSYMVAGQSICQALLQRIPASSDPFSPVGEVLQKLEQLQRIEDRLAVRALSDSRDLVAA